MSLCTDLVLVNSNGHSGEAIGLKCKRWSCKTCNPDNRFRVMQLAARGQPNIFLTLTISSKSAMSPDDAASAMRAGLVKLRRKIAERWGVENIPFICVFERHKSGRPHMHLLLRGPYLHQRVLLAMWRSIMGLAGVNIKFIKHTAKVLYYITKYIGKDLAKFEGCKRYWRSQNWEVEKEEKQQMRLFGDCLYLDRVNFDMFTGRLRASGFNIKRKSEDKIFFIHRDDWMLRSNVPAPWADARRVRQSPIAIGGP